MRVGMAVNVPKTEEELQNLRKLILLLDEAALHAAKAGLYIAGDPGSDFLGAVTDQLMETWRRNIGSGS
jgi:hypothetical protein